LWLVTIRRVSRQSWRPRLRRIFFTPRSCHDLSNQMPPNPESVHLARQPVSARAASRTSFSV
jgi:hypothetical protein